MYDRYTLDRKCDNYVCVNAVTCLRGLVSISGFMDTTMDKRERERERERERAPDRENSATPRPANSRIAQEHSPCYWDPTALVRIGVRVTYFTVMHS